MMKIAYPIELFDRNITDGRADDRLVPDADHRQQPGHGRRRARQDVRLLRAAARYLQLFDGPSKDITDLWRMLGRPVRRWRLHRRHHHQAQARPASRAVRQCLPTSSGSAATSSRTTNRRATRCSAPIKKVDAAGRTTP
ncbi:MAG: hypothetical protein MZV49_18115 [Rhodopseudomonas palustris]|nr:hypothetical protein [Rhodopseudomonas palustris]